jgi:hypothetical protein
MLDRHHESAFPVPIGQVAEDHQGLSIRDWFAGQAIQGLLTEPRQETEGGDHHVWKLSRNG